MPLSCDIDPAAGFSEGENWSLKLRLEHCWKEEGESLLISPDVDILEKAKENGVTEF